MANKNKLRGSTTLVDKEALKIFADAPKMAITVVSFITSAGAIMFRLSTAAKASCDPTTVTCQYTLADFFSFDTLVSSLFVIGLCISFYSIILSYGLISSITACFLEITDNEVPREDQQETWSTIRDSEYPTSEVVMMIAVAVWLIVILLSAFAI